MSEPANDAKAKRVDTDDWLGYGVYADTLWARIEAALVKDASTGTLGSDPLVIDQRANVNQLVGNASVVGLYPANPMVVYDMAGNVWEWMDNPFGSVSGPARRVRREAKKVDFLSLRGGSWVNRPGRASCSYPGRNRPDDRSEILGFRVVLSLAENES